ncbi:MAG: hypothetical protein JSV62_14375 [Promethearchaeota archaeon]|nr:MAG: hypothetical protein JSV62_14375 [Candidatus Lokiarchaeota archaeon]
MTLSVTVVSILGALSATLILYNPDNIGINPGNIDINFNYPPMNINFTFPFNITNAGFFDLENLELKIDLAMNYTHVNYPIPGVNTTKVIPIYSNSTNFGTIPKGTTGNFNFTGLWDDFSFPGISNFTTDIDWFRGPPAILFYANFTVSLDYSIGLHSLTIGFVDIYVGGFP